MAYSELIKDFNRIRAYLRSFYVYGFRHRNEFTMKSARSYDNERRRVESWLGDYMKFGQDADGRRVFLSVDSRSVSENPLYRAFRTKSFTDRDITLHFHIMDILKVNEGVTIMEMMDELTDRLSDFASDDMPDESTVRKKLKEYVEIGLIGKEKQGRETIYIRNKDHIDLSTWDSAAAFFSEVAPVGVIGSFIQDRILKKFDRFRFKHHYILDAPDSEILYDLLIAIREHRMITFTVSSKRLTVLPLKIYIGTQTGRRYLLAMASKSGKFAFFRIDLIDKVKAEKVFEYPEDLLSRLDDFCSHSWGVTGNSAAHTEHLEMTIFARPGEEHIVNRLEREKRCGTVTQLDETHWKFTADVYNALEMMPWVRTFTGRISDLQCTDDLVINRFRNDLDKMMKMYGGGDSDAV